MDEFNFDAERSGKYLKSLRIRYNKTQDDVGEACGVGRSQVSSAENGRYKFSIDSYVRLMNFYNGLGASITLNNLILGQPDTDQADCPGGEPRPPGLRASAIRSYVSEDQGEYYTSLKKDREFLQQTIERQSVTIDRLTMFISSSMVAADADCRPAVKAH